MSIATAVVMAMSGTGVRADDPMPAPNKVFIESITTTQSGVGGFTVTFVVRWADLPDADKTITGKVSTQAGGGGNVTQQTKNVDKPSKSGTAGFSLAANGTKAGDVVEIYAAVSRRDGALFVGGTVTTTIELKN